MLKTECVNPPKPVNFLGQIMKETGVRAHPDKVRAVTNMVKSADVSGVRRFLGIVNHLGKYLPHLAEKTLLSAKNIWTRGDAQQGAFGCIK